MKRLLSLGLIILIILSCMALLSSCGDDGMLGHIGGMLGIGGKPDGEKEEIEKPEDETFDVEMVCGNTTNVITEVVYDSSLLSHIVSCVSLDPTVATVTADGVVSAVAPGSTSVVVKLDNGATLTFNVTVKERTLPTHTHTAKTVAGEVVSAASCTANERRYELVVCEGCGEELDRKVVEVPDSAKGHTDGEPVKENSTATSYDLVVRCKDCGHEISRETVIVEGGSGDGGSVGDGNEPCRHSNTTTVTENEHLADCESGAYHHKVVYCADCGDELSRTVVNTAPPSHKPGAEVKENETVADCNADGSYELVIYCTECGDEISRDFVTVPSNGHKEGAGQREFYIEPSCLTPGSYDIAYYCTACGAETRRESFVTGTTAHTRQTYIEDGGSSTCSLAGWYYEVVWCPVCRSELDRTMCELPLLDHTPSETYIENEDPSTCTEKGSYEAVVYCLACGTEVSRDEHEIDYAPHTGGNAVRENEVESTCATHGSYDSVTYCTVCGEEASRESVVAELLPHSYGEWYGNSATCILGGEEKRNCGSCGHIDSRETEANGHNFENFVCTVCGEVKESSGLSFTLSEDESYYIVSGMGECTDTEVAIPAKHKGLPVREIGASAFSTNKTSVTLTAVLIPDCVVSIGDYAFQYQRELTLVNLPSELTYIGIAAFNYTGISGDIVIPDKVKTIHHGSFDDTAITSIYIPAATTFIFNSFVYCSSLKEITVHPDNTEYASVDGNLYDKNVLMLYKYAPANERTEFEPPITCHTFYQSSMRGANNIEVLVLHENFLEGIEGSAVLGCRSIKEFRVHADNPNFKSVDGNLYSKDGTRLYRYAPAKSETSFTVPSGVLDITYAFVYCESLCEVILPSGIEEVGSEAFAYCTALTRVEIPEGVKAIGNHAFTGCKLLVSVDLPLGLLEIGGDAFSRSGLTEIVIPDSVTDIGDYVFNGCESLERLTVGSGVKVIGSGFASNCTALTGLTIGSGVESIGSRAFGYCTALTEVVIPDSVGAIGSTAFEFCGALESVSFGVGLKTIGNGAFYYCVKLDGVIMPDSLREIGSGAFGYCEALKELSLNDGLEAIGSDAFFRCAIEGALVIPESVKTIGGSAFSDCVGITSLVIGSDGDGGLSRIESAAFFRCSGIKNITFKSSIKAIESMAFQYCRSLEEIIIPDNVNEVGQNAFDHCISATRIVIGNGVSVIDRYGFYWCESVRELVVGSALTEVKWMGLYFEYDHVLESVYYFGSAEEWSEIAFEYGSHNVRDATVYYYSEGEPTVEGNFWHYDNDGNPVVWGSEA